MACLFVTNDKDGRYILQVCFLCWQGTPTQQVGPGCLPYKRVHSQGKPSAPNFYNLLFYIIQSCASRLQVTSTYHVGCVTTEHTPTYACSSEIRCMCSYRPLQCGILTRDLTGILISGSLKAMSRMRRKEALAKCHHNTWIHRDSHMISSLSPTSQVWSVAYFIPIYKIKIFICN